jgi:DNA polymerase III gamma/tau subunit
MLRTFSQVAAHQDYGICDDALHIIAQADGAMRDALSILIVVSYWYNLIVKKQ